MTVKKLIDSLQVFDSNTNIYLLHPETGEIENPVNEIVDLNSEDRHDDLDEGEKAIALVS